MDFLGQQVPNEIAIWGKKIDQVNKTGGSNFWFVAPMVPFEKQSDLWALVKPLVDIFQGEPVGATSRVPGEVLMDLPHPSNPEYFELLAICESAATARHRYVFVEIGAGWGKRSQQGYLANRQAHNLPVVLVATEADPTHFQFLLNTYVANGINPLAHKLYFAALARQSGSIEFQRVNPDTQYGAGAFAATDLIGTSRVEAISLPDLLSPYFVVDMIDFDCQGCELEVIQASTEILNERVKAMWIETHSVENHRGLLKMFEEHVGWDVRIEAYSPQFATYQNISSTPEGGAGSIYAVNRRIQ